MKHNNNRRSAEDGLVGRAVAKSKLEKTMMTVRSHLTRISVQAYLTDDGEEAPVLLGDLALILGIGAEIGMYTAPNSSKTRQMHAALRMVLAMSIDGRKWKSAQAEILHKAAMMAGKAFEDHTVIGIAMMPGVCDFSAEVRNGTARMDAVAGPEIYNS